MSTLVIGTRGSSLALWQAEFTKSELKRREPDLAISIRVLKTTGDRVLDTPLAAIGGKGLFIKEIEEALLRHEVDVAVHSMKDVPTDLAPGLVLAGVSAREDPSDAIVSRHRGGLKGLPPGAVVGTSSLRRACQLKANRPDLKIVPLRGNVETRLRKLDSGSFDAIVLATAGLLRLDLGKRISERLPFTVCLPAAGQGILGLEAREDDPPTRTRLGALSDPHATDCVTAERAFLQQLGGGCQTPVAAHARIVEGGDVTIDGFVGSVDGSRILREHLRGPRTLAKRLGQKLADLLLERGAADLLASALVN
ncbi:MAG: hydroxymethylbilane synthase [Pseudomonadota bacterium]